jgi:autotransporter-associated beta strand protein
LKKAITDDVSLVLNQKSKKRSKALRFLVFLIFFFLVFGGLRVSKVSAATKIWTGATNSNWNTSSNWSPSGVPASGDDLVFPAWVTNKTLNNDITAGTSFNSLILKGVGYTLSGNDITLGAGGIIQSGLVTNNIINFDIALGANITINMAGLEGYLTIAGAISSGASYSITKQGPGSLTLSNANTHSGGTTLSAGTLNINNANALGTGTFTITTGTIDNTTGGGITNAGNNAIVLGGNFVFGGTQDLNLGTGAITNAGSRTITLNGTSKTLTLGGTMTNGVAGTQTTTVDGVGNTLVLGAYNLSNSATSYTGVFAGSGNVRIPGVVADGGTATLSNLTYSGLGIFTLAGTNTYRGVTTVSTGTVLVETNAPSGSAGALGNATSEVVLGTTGSHYDASILVQGAYTIGRDIRIPTNNTIDTGSRVLILGGNTGDSSIFSGNIFLGTNSQAGKGFTMTTVNGGDVTFSGVIQDPSSMDATTYEVTKSGAGKVVLSNTNTYTGSTSISEGSLWVNGSISTGDVSVSSNAILGGSGTIAGTVSTANNARIQPGSATDTIGTLTLIKLSPWNPTATSYLDIDLDGTNKDLLNITGGVGSLSLSNISLEINSLSPPSGTPIDILSYASGDISDTFASTTGIPAGYMVNITNTLVSLTSTPIYSVTVTTDGIVDYGFVALSGVKDTTGISETQIVQNNGNATEKFSVKSSDAIGGVAWTLGTSIGTDIFKHEFSLNGGTGWTGMPDISTYVTAATSVAVNDTKNFDFKISMPSATTDYLQKSITLTVLASAP